MTQSKLKYLLPGELGAIEFSPQVLSHFEKHKQLRFLSYEAGGQLFAVQGENGCTEIIDVTGPRKTDRRSRNEYIPDRVAEQKEILERYAYGRHFIGDWHTHREDIPNPSSKDQKSMREMVLSSSHDLEGFIMVIIGLAKFPKGIHVSFHTRTSTTVLSPCDL